MQVADVEGPECQPVFDSAARELYGVMDSVSEIGIAVFIQIAGMFSRPLGLEDDVWGFEQGANGAQDRRLVEALA